MSMVMAILGQGALLALAVLLAGSALLGVLVLIRPALLERILSVTDREVSLIPLTDWLDRPRNVDRWIYRNHRLYGAAVILLALLLLYFLGFGYRQEAWAAAIAPGSKATAGLVLDWLRIVLWLLGVLALMVGTLIFVRPSTLKGVEGRLNRWLSADGFARSLDRGYHPLDHWAARHARLAGGLIAVASLACLLPLLLSWDDLTGLIRTLAG